jgi:hypothetical protein
MVKASTRKRNGSKDPRRLCKLVSKELSAYLHRLLTSRTL